MTKKADRSSSFASLLLIVASVVVPVLSRADNYSVIHQRITPQRRELFRLTATHLVDLLEKTEARLNREKGALASMSANRMGDRVYAILEEEVYAAKLAKEWGEGCDGNRVLRNHPDRDRLGQANVMCVYGGLNPWHELTVNDREPNHGFAINLGADDEGNRFLSAEELGKDIEISVGCHFSDMLKFLTDQSSEYYWRDQLESRLRYKLQE